jgi:hypothetical protein
MSLDRCTIGFGYDRPLEDVCEECPWMKVPAVVDSWRELHDQHAPLLPMQIWDLVPAELCHRGARRMKDGRRVELSCKLVRCFHEEAYEAEESADADH